MIPEITNIMGVRRFIELLAGEIDNFHPLEEFSSYVYPDSYFRRYTDEEAEIRAKCLENCFEVCATITPDFYTYLIKLFEKERSGMLIEQ